MRIQFASNNMIGGSEAASGNVIAHNVREGVLIQSGSRRNTVRLNSIHSNRDLGIDLNTDGADVNDPNDSDDGANNRQNSPEIVLFNLYGPKVVGYFDSAPNTTYTLDFYANDPTVLNLGEGQRYVSTQMLTTDADGYVRFEFTLPIASPLGQFVTVTATDPDGNTSEFSHDADTDGLLDSWEMGEGVDGDGDGDYFLNAPDPLHKDLYVDIDAMGTIHAKMPGVADDMPFVFHRAPAPNVLNPDGTAGITLHFEIDPTPLAQSEVDSMEELRVVKNAQFGTTAERTNPALIAAKRMTHRYALFSPPNAEFGGLSWVYGHELVLAGGPESTLYLDQLFFHEVGHSLGLDHGGGDEVGFKPNYHSAMNGIWANRSPDPGPFQDSWELDYSDAALPHLDENNLDESLGIGGHFGHFVRIGPLPAVEVEEMGPVDWNRDGDTDDIIVTGLDLNRIVADANGDGVVNGADETPGEILIGHDDWSNLYLNFRHSDVYRLEHGLETPGAGASLPEAVPGFSHELVAEIHDIGYANKAPRILGLRDVHGNEGDTISFTVPATDPEGDTLTFTLLPGAPADASIHPTTGQFTWPTTPGDAGEYIVTVQVTDTGSLRFRERSYGLKIGTGLTGDYNLNGVVDAADYVVWRKTRGTTGPFYAGADSSGNGIIDQVDYLVWRANFGKTLPPPAIGAVASAAVAPTTPAAPAGRSAGEHNSQSAPRSPNQAAEPRGASPVEQLAESENFRPLLNSVVSRHSPYRPAIHSLIATGLTLAASTRDAALMAWLTSHPEPGSDDRLEGFSPGFTGTDRVLSKEDDVRTDSFDQIFELLANG